MSDNMLSLTTVLKDTVKFTVDGKQFEILGVDHLTPNEEAEVMALFSRYDLLRQELEGEKNVTKGAAKALEVRATRLTLLTKLTTLDGGTAALLPLTQQVRLLEAIQADVEDEDEGAEGVPRAEAEPEPAHAETG